MLRQDLAVRKIVKSLKQDELVQAIFLKGSMGRNDYDEHSDIDLYCLVNQEDEEAFLEKRLDHLYTYRDILFYDDIFIIAPQIIAVYDDMLHIDMFTVTLDSFVEKDYFRVLYDPNHLLERFTETQTLTLSDNEYRDDVNDVAWFMFQYSKTAARGNDIWAVKMLTNVMHHLARVLLHKYAPKRAQLGLKTVELSLPAELVLELQQIFEHITPDKHKNAVKQIQTLVSVELDWIKGNLSQGNQIIPLLEKMLEQ
ncbi:nucleotidyltransferase domain-containing protein [Bacillus sp. FJAT-49736]|uniref:nucleotidyltransferase domain-containing protein n=1 Tax=Bacillus sp. FJAT-49736 TaxID=2833582 RepID=UPI001BC9F837|nr:nucleotidyltransferase domain-containing protein [Bacillus sp. FJAT-49736]MBS4174814.1 nucleotidyltransferase domain-containing protein [Bacillus sp. FJAT-49736]MBS4175529.1 nucleotidyltransferase domain-containing protein [Bacillus sp. FJAT-49736]